MATALDLRRRARRRGERRRRRGGARARRHLVVARRVDARRRRHARRTAGPGAVPRARVARRSTPPRCATRGCARAGEFRLLVAHRGGQPGRARCRSSPSGASSPACRRASCARSPTITRSASTLLDPAHADEAARALVAHLSRARDWDVARAARRARRQRRRARCSSPPRAPPACRPASGRRWSRPTCRCRRASPSSTELGAKFRGNLRRRAKKLEAEVGPLALERIDGARASAVELDACSTKASRSRPPAGRASAGTAIACDSVAARAATARSPTPSPRAASSPATSSRAGERRVAFHFALVDGDIYYLFKPGFDPALASYGLGHLLVDAVARDLIARGVRELDFLGDDMPWKRDWTDQTRAHSLRYLFAPTARGRALAAWKFTLAPAAKRLWSRLHRS